LARSRSTGRRTSASRVSDDPRSSPAVGPATVPSLASATLPRVWQGLGYRPLPDAGLARPLFDFAAMPWPSGTLALGWGAYQDATLVGAVVGERDGGAVFLHGPVVVTESDPMEVAAQLVAAGLDHARALGVDTLFTRPQALDRVWVRFGFIPRPESSLPAALTGRPGSGLYAWRGGSALWTLRQVPEADDAAS